MPRQGQAVDGQKLLSDYDVCVLSQ